MSVIQRHESEWANSFEETEKKNGFSFFGFLGGWGGGDEKSNFFKILERSVSSNSNSSSRSISERGRSR